MTGTVISNIKILPGAQLYDLRFKLSEAAASALPGQFVHISCGPGFTLRRPISICEAGDGALRVCYDVRGKGTAYLSALAPGDIIDILPPTGHGFKVRESGRALLVGGGIGIYPLLWCAKLYGKRSDTALGFRTPELVNLDGEFAEHSTSVEVITDDRGFVTSLVENTLKRAESNGNQYAVVHTCGPKAMMRRVAETAEKFGVDCEVSMEERMACGVGACMGCVCKIRDGDGWTNKRVCVDGPVFDAREVIWQ